MDATSTQTLITGQVTAFGQTALVVLTSILGLAVLLIGAGYGWSRFKRYIHRRKI